MDIQIGKGRDYEPTTDSRNRIPFTATAQSVWEASGLVRLEALCLRVYLSLCLSVCRCVCLSLCLSVVVYMSVAVFVCLFIVFIVSIRELWIRFRNAIDEWF